MIRATILAALLLAGCAGPDTLCQTKRPAAALNDTAGTIAAQKAAAAVWDRHCTLLGRWK